MKTYSCTIEERYTYSIIVKANSKEDAMETAEDLHRQGHSNFNSLEGSECIHAEEQSE
jgi:hypothetical protein